MKILKFSRVNKDIVRVTYKNFWGKKIKRDAIRLDEFIVKWYWLDTNERIIYHKNSLEAFNDMEDIVLYNVNVSKIIYNKKF